MGQRGRDRLKWLVAFVIAFTAATTACAGIAFVNIADDTTGRFSTLSTASINNNGRVLFSASLQTGGSGIYLGSVTGGTPATIADTLGGFNNIATQAINNNGVISYGTSFDNGGYGIYRTGVNGALPHTTVATGGLPFLPSTYSNVSSLRVSDGGLLAFSAILTNGPTALYTQDGTTLTLVADSTGPFNPFDFSGMTINGSGTVAFTARFDTGSGSGLYKRSPGGPLIPVADTTTGPLSSFGSNSAINDAGTLVVRASNDNFVTSIYIFDAAGAMTTYATQNPGQLDMFATIGASLSMNSAGQIAFLGRSNFPGARNGIYFGNNPDTDQIIAEGDTLFGQTIATLRLSSSALNNRNEIAFAYTLMDGTEGIAVAQVPEPTSAAIVLSAAAFTLRRRGRRNSR